jgi:hypothetical protein
MVNILIAISILILYGAILKINKTRSSVEAQEPSFKDDLSWAKYELEIKHRCPFCRKNNFREGPSGGISVNIYCANCGAGFNISGPFGVTDIIYLPENIKNEGEHTNGK